MGFSSRATELPVARASVPDPFSTNVVGIAIRDVVEDWSAIVGNGVLVTVEVRDRDVGVTTRRTLHDGRASYECIFI